MNTLPTALPDIVFDGLPLSLTDIAALAERRAHAVLSPAPAFRERKARGAEFLDRLLCDDGVIYGVTTGYGDSCNVVIPLVAQDRALGKELWALADVLRAQPFPLPGEGEPR